MCAIFRAWPTGTDQSAHRPSRAVPPATGAVQRRVPRRRLEETCMRSRVLVAAIAVVALGVVAATASAGGNRVQANTLTVWLQVDAQSGWPDVVAAANQQFQSRSPRLDGQRPVPELGRPPPEVRRHPRRRQHAGRHRDGQHRDDEVHGGRRVRRHQRRASRSSPTRASWLKGLAKSGMYGGKLYGVPVLRGLARGHVPHRPLQEGRHHEARRPASRQFTADAHKLAAKQQRSVKGFSPVYMRRHRLVLRDELRLRLRRLDRHDARRQMGRRRSTRRSRSPA